MDETTPTSDSFPVGLKRSQIRKLSEHDFALYLFIFSLRVSFVCNFFVLRCDFYLILLFFWVFFSTIIARILGGGIGELSDL